MPDDSQELTAYGRTDVEAATREQVNQILNEPRIMTMGKKLIIEASSPGHFPGLLYEHFGINNMPPRTIDEQADAIIECVEAGAAAVHSHARDPGVAHRFKEASKRTMSPEIVAAVFDKVFKKADMVPLGHAWHPKGWQDLADADFMTPTKELLDLGKGNKYIQGNVVPTWIYPWSRRGLLSSWFTADAVKDGIKWLEANNVKPMIAMHMDHFIWFKNNIVDAGVLKGRPHFNIQEGKHGVNRSFIDPMSHLNLINSIEMIRRTVPDCTIGIHAGGRNWLPMTALGIMLGVDVVRVGIEDQFWAFPHKDKFIAKPAESVELVVQIARSLGRDIATPAEAREILGIKAT